MNTCPLLSSHMLAMWFARSAPMPAVAANCPMTFSQPVIHPMSMYFGSLPVSSSTLEPKHSALHKRA